MTGLAAERNHGRPASPPPARRPAPARRPMYHHATTPPHMARSRVDTSLERTSTGAFAYPLGVYPVEEFAPVVGYTAQFEPADGDDDEGQWEDWPDRYVYDVLITATRLEPLCRSLFALLPGRVYPILDILGSDAYREIDPYIAYDLVGFDRFMDSIRRHRGFLYEDGLVGFGAMSLDPFVYVFVDEHKYITVRVETSLRERVEGILAAFDLAAAAELKGVDGALHEHRTVLDAPVDRPDLLSFEEIIEELVDEWRLRLNVDAGTNVDDSGNDLGLTSWRCVIRRQPAREDEQPAYAEVLLRAANLDEAERLAFAAAGGDDPSEAPATGRPGGPEDDAGDAVLDEAWAGLALVAADRVTPEEYAALLADTPETERVPGGPADEPGVDATRWLLDA